MKKILIVEDEEVLRDMYIEKFTQAGYEVVAAGNAKTGIELAKNEKPNLILLDILLPKENGVYLLRKIRKMGRISSTQVVAFSNYDDPETKKEVLELGVSDYLIKTNFTPQEIVQRVTTYLD